MNPYENAARMRKVLDIMKALRLVGATREQVELAGPDEWELIEKLAGIKPTSAKTRAAVVDYVKRGGLDPLDWDRISA